MPVKAALAVTAPTPFKGESFPQYVLFRSVRGSNRQCIASEATSDVQALTPSLVVQIPATTLLTAAASRLEQDQPPPRRARIASIGFRRPLPSPSLRPSLSEQLKSISQGAQAITAQLATTYNLSGRTNAPALASSSSHAHADLPHDKLAFQATTIGLTVGKLECRFPCPATFASDRCTYLFQHPFETKEVFMVMYYRDMLHASVNMADHSFRFRLSRVLKQFGDDYNPKNAQHWIRIILATASEAKKVKLFLSSLGVTDTRRSFSSSRTEMSCKSHK
ncbi:hypothetical protein PF005_g21635 [Phytophthora fragariae]|uniref:Uncharacterized protein n=1 Tax=Phytophthora fragariae TaxID=53985 RepID=A0A6A3IRF5_9STRA|nr:hypothetical protein PF003_g35537 [Phytophthora fragariae]KAE8927137.1 hypothetical protein PF009_g22685 [Phytophthora fragariae]KAE8985549.1 hypothetical protein PF011_g20340 [Phytophthora fragariae]KAE9085126.1 hypothetical protein PF007_g21255 [Phytophthora fragariae]KAE9109535.1 hypothetical protein PF006_g20647 [Phytophthora fragariae]